MHQRTMVAVCASENSSISSSRCACVHQRIQVLAWCVNSSSRMVCICIGEFWYWHNYMVCLHTCMKELWYYLDGVSASENCGIGVVRVHHRILVLAW